MSWSSPKSDPETKFLNFENRSPENISFFSVGTIEVDALPILAQGSVSIPPENVRKPMGQNGLIAYFVFIN